MPRIFVAIPLDAHVRNALDAWPKPDIPTARWVRKEQYHITLKFLGDVTPPQVESVGAAVRQIASEWSGPIQLGVEGIGAFPNVKRARIVWAGLVGDIQGLAGLQRRVEDALATEGFEREERAFRPHITLARIKVPQPLPRFEGPSRSFGRWTAQCIQVMESVLHPEGARYSVRVEAPLPTV